LRAARIIAGTRQRRLLTRWLLTFNWLLVAGLARRAQHSPGVHVFDQGMLQAVWSVALEGDADAAMRLLELGAELGFMPEVAVVVAADADTVQQRLDGRHSNDSRLDRAHDRLPELLERGDGLLKRIRDHLRREARSHLIVLNNGAQADPEKLADSLAADLEQLAVVAVKT
jgi:hypothetical protein